MYIQPEIIQCSVGFDNSQSNLQLACKESVAMLFMFDLTSRCTLNRFVLILHSGNNLRLQISFHICTV